MDVNTVTEIVSINDLQMQKTLPLPPIVETVIMDMEPTCQPSESPSNSSGGSSDSHVFLVPSVRPRRLRLKSSVPNSKPTTTVPIVPSKSNSKANSTVPSLFSTLKSKPNGIGPRIHFAWNSKTKATVPSPPSTSSTAPALQAASPPSTANSLDPKLTDGTVPLKPKEPIWYACPTCRRAFPDIKLVREHLKNDHKMHYLKRNMHNGDNSFVTVGMKTLKLTQDTHIKERHLNVLKSKIHGKGLFSSRFIRKEEIIVEYTGDIINRHTALKRQNEYDLKKIDYYIMKVGNFIIDATVTGNCSKYINNSCDPNCTAELIDISGKSRVLVMAARNILAGEELTYDYQFTSDELIPCNCRAVTCRRFLNCNVDKLNLSQQHITELIKTLQ